MTKRSVKDTAGALAIKLRNDARQAARRIRTFGAEKRESFCARTPPPPTPDKVKVLVNRAMRYATDHSDTYESFEIGDENSARRVADKLSGELLKWKKFKREYGARWVDGRDLLPKDIAVITAAEAAARHWSWWTQNHDTNELRDAKDYARAVIDEATS